MSMFLTKKERRQFDYHGPSQNFDSDEYNTRNRESIDYFDQHWELPEVQIFVKEYSEADAKRVAAAITSFNEMGFKRFSETFILRVLDAAEESGLSVVAVLGCLEDFLRVQKTTPSYAHFCEFFDEARSKLQEVHKCHSFVHATFSAYADEVGHAFSQENLDYIRKYIPDFPDIGDLNRVWKKAFGQEYGVGSFFDIVQCREFSKKMVKAINRRFAWPVIELHQLSIADQAGEIPEEWDEEIDQKFKGLFQREPEFFKSMTTLEVYFQPDEPDTDEWGDDKF